MEVVYTVILMDNSHHPMLPSKVFKSFDKAEKHALACIIDGKPLTTHKVGDDMWTIGYMFAEAIILKMQVEE